MNESVVEQYTEKAYFVILAGVELWIKEIQRLELFSITQTGAIWAWVLASSSAPKVKQLGLAIPLILNLLVAIKFAAIYLHLRTHVRYLREYEHRMRLGNAGWETFLETQRKGRHVLVPMRLFELTFIGLILAASLLAFLLSGEILAAR